MSFGLIRVTSMVDQDLYIYLDKTIANSQSCLPGVQTCALHNENWITELQCLEIISEMMFQTCFAAVK